MITFVYTNSEYVVRKLWRICLLRIILVPNYIIKVPNISSTNLSSLRLTDTSWLGNSKESSLIYSGIFSSFPKWGAKSSGTIYWNYSFWICLICSNSASNSVFWVLLKDITSMKSEGPSRMFNSCKRFWSLYLCSSICLITYSLSSAWGRSEEGLQGSSMSSLSFFLFSKKSKKSLLRLIELIFLF